MIWAFYERWWWWWWCDHCYQVRITPLHLCVIVLCLWRCRLVTWRKKKTFQHVTYSHDYGLRFVVCLLRNVKSPDFAFVSLVPLFRKQQQQMHSGLNPSVMSQGALIFFLESPPLFCLPPNMGGMQQSISVSETKRWTRSFLGVCRVLWIINHVRLGWKM